MPWWSLTWQHWDTIYDLLASDRISGSYDWISNEWSCGRASSIVLGCFKTVGPAIREKNKTMDGRLHLFHDPILQKWPYKYMEVKTLLALNVRWKPYWRWKPYLPCTGSATESEKPNFRFYCWASSDPEVVPWIVARLSEVQVEGSDSWMNVLDWTGIPPIGE